MVVFGGVTTWGKITLNLTQHPVFWQLFQLWQADGEQLLEEVRTLFFAAALFEESKWKRDNKSGNTRNFSRHAFCYPRFLINWHMSSVCHFSHCFCICSNPKFQSIECRRCCGGQRAWLGPLPEAMESAIILPFPADERNRCCKSV